MKLLSISYSYLLVLCLSFAACKKNTDLIQSGSLQADNGNSSLTVTCIPESIIKTGSTNLSQPRSDMFAAGTGSRILFAYGYKTDLTISNHADIYNTTLGTWTTTVFNKGADLAAAAACVTRIIVAGGENGTETDVAHIYDVTNDHWGSAKLSVARFRLAAAGYGNKILFGGGQSGTIAYTRVDIYDATTNTWTTSDLSEGRTALSAASANNKILFGGGVVGPSEVRSKTVDIYDVTTGQWSTSSLSKARGYMSAIGISNLIFFAGGSDSNNTNYDLVDIYNTTTGVWTTAHMAHTKGTSPICGRLGTKVFFHTGSNSNPADVYDICSNSWGTMMLDAGNTTAAFGNDKLLVGDYFISVYGIGSNITN